MHRKLLLQAARPTGLPESAWRRPYPHSAAGLTAYGRGGELIAGATLPEDVVRAAFEFSAAHDVPLCGFLGEECVTHKMHPELEELHYRWVLCPLPAAALCCLLLRHVLGCLLPHCLPRRSCSTGGCCASCCGELRCASCCG
jgi:hypothetical protein